MRIHQIIFTFICFFNFSISSMQKEEPDISMSIFRLYEKFRKLKHTSIFETINNISQAGSNTKGETGLDILETIIKFAISKELTGLKALTLAYEMKTATILGKTFSTKEWEECGKLINKTCFLEYYTHFCRSKLINLPAKYFLNNSLVPGIKMNLDLNFSLEKKHLDLFAQELATLHTHKDFLDAPFITMIRLSDSAFFRDYLMYIFQKIKEYELDQNLELRYFIICVGIYLGQNLVEELNDES